MNLKTLALAGVALAMISGAAIAQSGDTSTSGANGSTPPGAVLDDSMKMKPFFSDADMKTMRTGDEFKAAWMAMNSDDQTKVKNECMNTNSPRAEFCEQIKNMK